MKLWGDLETYSATPISHGTYRYAANAEIMLYAWAIDDEPAQVWDLTDGSPMPFDLEQALTDAKCEVWFHNSMFDRTVKRAFMPERTPPIARWRDTMVQALCHSMPGKLSTLCEVLGVDADKAKSKRGAYLVQLFCKPRGKSSKVERATRETHPAEWAEFVDYARLDVEAMREVHKKLPTWNYRGDELALWHLDQTINDRGIAVDLDLVHAAVAAVAEEQIALAAATVEMTGGAVEAATQRDAMLQHMLAEYGVQLPNMQASTLERRLDDPDVPEAMKALLRVRLQSSTTSTSKYLALQRSTNLDGRIRGLLQFAGASRTARWAGRTFQPQNLPRPSLRDDEVDVGIDALKAGTAGLIFPNVMAVSSSAIRGCLVAADGKKMPIADLANIEGRALAWLAGEQWKVEAFNLFDTVQLADGGWINGPALRTATLEGRRPALLLDAKGEPTRMGHDLYKLAYAKSFGIAPEDVTKDNRQVGKVQELACFGADTLVLTPSGAKPITQVEKDDKLWDGKNWVAHQGLLERGLKLTLRLAGIDVTPGHLILTQGTWRPAKQLASCENTLCQALATASENLPYWVSSAYSAAHVPPTWCAYSAPAAQNHTSFTHTTYATEKVQGATLARKNRPGTGAKTFGLMQAFAQSTTIGGACLTASRPPSLAVTAPRHASITDMAGAAFSYTSLGEKIVQRFSAICSRWTVGTTLVTTWTASTWMGATCRAISALFPRTRTGAPTSAPSGKCKSESSRLRPVFDILNSGPNNRFTILTERGPLIVHNCGYAGGVGAFSTFATAFGLDLDELAANVLPNADPALVEQATKFLEWQRKQPGHKPMAMSDEAFIGCDVVKRGWRQGHPAIAAWWPMLEQAFRDAVASPGYTFDCGSVRMRRDGSWLRIALPSGRYLCYPGADIDDHGRCSYMGVDQYTRKWQRIHTYSGKLAENITQAFARDVLAHSMPEIERRGYALVLSVHDELLTETPDTPEFSADELSALMATVPPWAKGLPLAAEGFETNRYRK